MTSLAQKVVKNGFVVMLGVGSGVQDSAVAILTIVALTSSVIVDQPGQVYVLSQAKLNELEEIDPHLEAAPAMRTIGQRQRHSPGFAPIVEDLEECQSLL